MTTGGHHIVWVDAQLPPALAIWLRETYSLDAHALRDLGLRDADDFEIYEAAKTAGAVLISKDSDFVDLVQTRGIPPWLLWVTCGNVTNDSLKAIFMYALPKALEMLATGEPIIEIG